MARFLNRREFASGITIGLTAMKWPFESYADEQKPELPPTWLVEHGINALARAAQRNYFADGHRGAAMISAHLMCVDNNFKPPTRSRIAELFRLNWGQSSLCAAFPEGDRVQDAVDRVGQSLAQGGGVLREVGHDAIFAMHAIKGFRMLPAIATKQRVDGICNLIRSFKPWRDEDPDNSIVVPPFSDEVAASRFVLREASNAIDRFRGFGQGFAGHMLTYGQSLIELAAMDGTEWAESCRTAFHKYVTVTRKGPQAGDRKIKDHQPTALRPDDSDYWQQRGNKTLGLGHVFKYPYAYYDLLARAEDEQLTTELNAKAWHLF